MTHTSNDSNDALVLSVKHASNGATITVGSEAEKQLGESLAAKFGKTGLVFAVSGSEASTEGGIDDWMANVRAEQRRMHELDEIDPDWHRRH